MGRLIPKLPLPVRILNSAGTAARAMGFPVGRLDMDYLLETAATTTGLDDFGGSFFREPLSVLLESLESEAHLTPIGRIAMRDEIVRVLGNRLRMTDVIKRNPEIMSGPVERPLFIVGMPRTGTSILHELLAQDPENRTPMTWELWDAWPPPETATFRTDPRIEAVDEHFAQVDRLIPDFKSIHPMGATLPQECVGLMELEFATIQFHTTHRVPTYQRWLEGIDQSPVYRSHRKQLQYFQWRHPAQQWVLKSPAHLWLLNDLLREYPDACIIQTHRDPLKVVASLVSLMSTLRKIASDAVDPLEIAEDWTVRVAEGLQAAHAARRAAALPDSRVFDMHFHELVADEIAMVRRIYAHFGRTLSDDAESRMRAFLAENSRDQRGRHRYSFADTGLDEAEERTRFARYQDRYQVPSERVA